VHLPTRKTLQLHFPSLYNVPADVSLPTIPGTAMYHPSTRTLLIRCTPQASPFLSDSEVSGTISPSPSLTSILSVPHVKQEGRALLHAKEWWNGVKGIGVVHGGVVRLSGGLSDM
jgi:methionyl-tRNA formyltransferase